jgi:hypothetical protein
VRADDLEQRGRAEQRAGRAAHLRRALEQHPGGLGCGRGGLQRPGLTGPARAGELSGSAAHDQSSDAARRLRRR